MAVASLKVNVYRECNVESKSTFSWPSVCLLRWFLTNSGLQRRSRHGFDTHLNWPMDFAGRYKSISLIIS